MHSPGIATATYFFADAVQNVTRKHELYAFSHGIYSIWKLRQRYPDNMFSLGKFDSKDLCELLLALFLQKKNSGNSAERDKHRSVDSERYIVNLVRQLLDGLSSWLGHKSLEYFLATSPESPALDIITMVSGPL